MKESVHTTLQFAGDWPWWAGVGAAVLLGGTAFALYRPDVRHGARTLRWLLPALRALAVAMIVIMLSGPVLHHRRVVGQLSRLLLLVDTSRSMGLADASMELGRKLRILQGLGFLRTDAVKMELPQAGEALGEMQVLARKAGTSQGLDAPEWSRLLTDAADRAEEARKALEQAGAGDRASAFGREVADPAREIARREMRQIDDRQRAARELAPLADAAGRWQAEIAERFRKETMEGAGASALSPVNVALQRFDSLTRAQRLQGMLLEGEKGKLLQRLAEKHEVQLYALAEGKAEKVWQSAGRETAFAGFGKPTAETTDLAKPLEAVLGNDRAADEKGAIVLFSDGQHNEGDSPLESAKILGARQLPIFTVGYGSATRPHDLAVTGLQAPETVFAEDQVRGTVTLKDDMPPGLPFVLSVKDGERTVWEQKLATTGANLRTVPFEFPISQSVQERVARERTARAGVQVAGLPLELKVSVSALAGDGEPNNNALDLRLRALTQKRRILLIDGRPRWEARYLRNLFERDEQWEINTVLSGAAPNEPGLMRGTAPGQLPTDLAQLAGYDLIILGEIPAADWKTGELQALRDFVEKRGAALVFIDGPRGWFREYAQTPLAPLFPVEWKGEGLREKLGHLVLADRAQTLAPFTLAGDRARSVEAWHSMPAPHWLSGATPLPGSETLVSVEAPGQPNDRAAAVVFRPFGAGRVLYAGLEDSWRWRYEVADQYHTRYWNQVADWISELPFAVHDKLVSLDAGAVTYRPGETADLRVRLRDGEGRPVANAVADAVLYRDGVRIAALRLAPDENAGGLFHGRTAPLEPGSYEVAVESAALAAPDAMARTSFKVEPRATGELTELSLNEELLRQMAATSGGQYLSEENAGRLVELLAPLSHGEVTNSETVLWQSRWWFFALILVFTLEWILRKRAGML